MIYFFEAFKWNSMKKWRFWFLLKKYRLCTITMRTKRGDRIYIKRELAEKQTETVEYIIQLDGAENRYFESHILYGPCKQQSNIYRSIQQTSPQSSVRYPVQKSLGECPAVIIISEIMVVAPTNWWKHQAADIKRRWKVVVLIISPSLNIEQQCFQIEKHFPLFRTKLIAKLPHSNSQTPSNSGEKKIRIN